MGMPASEIMRDHVITATPETLVDDVAAELSDAHVGCAVIVEDERPVGIVTDRDVCVRLDANWVHTRHTTVDEMMSTDLVTAEVDASILELSRTMAEHEIRRLPILDDGELVGIVTQDDLLVLLSEELDNLAGTVEAESPPAEWGRVY